MKTAFVTGASRGIGKGVALGLAEMGYRVVLVATDKAKLEKVAQEIVTQFQLDPSNEPLIFPLNISHEDAVAEAIKKTHKKTSSIDVLFNGAGIARSGTSELSHQDLLAMLEVNLIGALHCVRHIAPFMKQKRSGYIFNVSSRAGKIGMAPIGGYSASKFGLVGFSEALFNELTAFGIKVTALCPGYVDTDMAAGSPIANEDKMPVEDIVKIVQCLLSLSPNCCIREIIQECRKTVELMNEALIKSR